MAKVKRTMGVEEARRLFPHVLDNASRGIATVITRHGTPCATVSPYVPAATGSHRAGSLLALRGTGRGLYGDAGLAVGDQRKEWD